jgi:biuret amidohydrolase
MSAFEATPLAIALRDCGLNTFAIVGVALEIGIEPTVRQGADLGFIPIVADACGSGDAEAFLTGADEFCTVLAGAEAG